MYRLRQPVQSLHGSTPSSACVLWLPVQYFYEIIECVNEWISVSCSFSWVLLSCSFFLSTSNVLVFVLSILFYHYPLEASFLERDRTGVDLEGREIQGTGKGRKRGNCTQDIM